MVYLLKMVIVHGYVSHNQRVIHTTSYYLVIFKIQKFQQHRVLKTPSLFEWWGYLFLHAWKYPAQALALASVNTPQSLGWYNHSSPTNYQVDCIQVQVLNLPENIPWPLGHLPAPASDVWYLRRRLLSPGRPSWLRNEPRPCSTPWALHGGTNPYLADRFDLLF